MQQTIPETKNARKKNHTALFLLFLFVMTVFSFYECYRGYNQYVHCVIVEEETDFMTGTRIISSKYIFDGRVLTDECTRKDNEIDHGDGPEKGKVRWLECFCIDCDEMYK